jgi:hypothetical protein
MPSKIMAWVVLLFCAMAAQAGGNQSFMPKLINIDSLVSIFVPQDSGIAVSQKLPYFKQISVDSGKMCPKNGILISERTAAEYVLYKSNSQLLAKESTVYKYLLKDYYDKAVDAETVYQSQMQQLQKDVKRGWWERNQGYIGFVLGGLAVIATEYAVIKVAK